MTCDRIRIVQNNLTLSGTLSAIPPTAKDINNCKLARRSKLVRWTAIDQACVLTLQLAEPNFIDSIAVIGHNVSSAGYMILRAYGVGDTLIYESGELGFGRILPAWGVEFTWGVDPLGVANVDGLPNVAIAFFERQIATRVDITFYDPANALNAIDFRHLFVGESFQPSTNFKHDWQYTETNGLEYEETDGGSLFPINLPRVRRHLSMPMEWLMRDELHRLLADRRIYANKPVLVSLYPSGSTQDIKTFSMLAKMNESQYSSPFDNEHSTTWEFTEL